MLAANSSLSVLTIFGDQDQEKKDKFQFQFPSLIGSDLPHRSSLLTCIKIHYKFPEIIHSQTSLGRSIPQSFVRTKSLVDFSLKISKLNGSLSSSSIGSTTSLRPSSTFESFTIIYCSCQVQERHYLQNWLQQILVHND